MYIYMNIYIYVRIPSVSIYIYIDLLVQIRLWMNDKQKSIRKLHVVQYAMSNVTHDNQ